MSEKHKAKSVGNASQGQAYQQSKIERLNLLRPQMTQGIRIEKDSQSRLNQKEQLKRVRLDVKVQKMEENAYNFSNVQFLANSGKNDQRHEMMLGFIKILVQQMQLMQEQIEEGRREKQLLIPYIQNWAVTLRRVIGQLKEMQQSSQDSQVIKIKSKRAQKELEFAETVLSHCPI